MAGGIPKSQRLMRLERHLARLPEGARVADLAQLLGVYRSTVYRDIEALEEAGLPIWQEAGHVGLLVDKYLAPLRLNIFEALSLFIAARLLSRQSKERDPHVEALLEKLADTLPPPVSRHVLKSAEAIRRSPENRDYVQTLEVLMRAWVNGQSVRMWYQRAWQDDVKERLFDIYFIEPLEHVYSCYVIGLDHSHGEIRSFKVKRIRRIELTEEKYRIPSKFDIFQRWANSWGIIMAVDAPPIHVKLQFTKNMAFMIKEAIWHHSQKIEDTEDGGCLLTVTVSDLSEIKLWIRGWGAAVQVLEPERLRVEITHDARDVYLLYQDSDTDTENAQIRFPGDATSHH
jgi:predicted DNA-binding transcriptional regulator YafY